MYIRARFAFVLIAILLVSLSCALAAPIAKHLSGPPSEFAATAIPNPLAAAVQESSAFLTGAATESSSTNVDSETVFTLSVDSTTFFSFAIFTQHTTSYSIKLVNPKGEIVEGLAEHAVVEKVQFGDDTLKTVTYEFTAPIVGEYTLYIQYSNGFMMFKQSNPRNTSIAFAKDFADDEQTEIDAVVLLYNESPYRILSHVNTYTATIGNKISIVSQLFDTKESTFDRSASPLQRPTPLRKSMFVEESIQVELSMAHPDGLISEIPMNDQTEIEGVGADDGLYVATFRPLSAGLYYARVKFTATLDDNAKTQLVRTTQQIVAVVHNEVQLTGTAIGKIQEGQDQVRVYLEVETSSLGSHTVRPYAQVWGTAQNGSVIPVCWISTVNTSILIGGKRYVPMEINSNWLSLAEAQFPLYLRNVSLQDTDTYLVISEVAEIPLTIQDQETLKFVQYKESRLVTITEEMISGVRPSHLVHEVAVSNGITGKLILVHGYCSKTNPWIEYSSDWTDVDFVEFSLCADSNSVFAQKVVAFAESKGYTSFSLVGYSQGGMAISELRTKYWSGADVPKNGNVLQSVVTPYKGQSLAGSTANLGKIFGVGCGSVYDMTLDGANLWGATIPTSTRQEVSYYYVQFADKGFNTRFCNKALNTQLDKPNDGVTEVARAGFSGGHDMGLTVGECHTQDMKYPPAFANHARNQKLNAAAARS